MNSALDEPAVRAYLADLSSLLEGVPDRSLIVDGVKQHIEDALDGNPASPARVKTVLAELGDPATIAAEATADAPPTRPPFLQRRAGAVLTVLLLTLGGVVVPVAGWVAGLGLLWASRGWNLREKLIGTFAPFVLTAVLLAIAAGIDSISTIRTTHLAVILGLFIGAIAAAAFLLRRFRERAGRQTHSAHQ